MKARTRAVATAAGAALVVVPLSGAAAFALVSQKPVTPDAEAFAEAGADLAQQISAASITISADANATFEANTPEVGVVANPVPSSQRASARAIANSADVAQAIAGSAIIAEAAKYVGIRYVAGGKSPDTGFDCSGFTSYVYAQFGISLPTSSRAYYNIGTRVDSPQPGDIIVTPGHVGLYAGPNLQIDAPTSGNTIQFRAIWQKNPVYIRIT